MKSNIDIILRLIKTEENLGNDVFIEQKGRIEMLLKSVDSLNEQINNDYLENEAEGEVVVSHNISETAYCFHVSKFSSTCKWMEYRNLPHHLLRL